MRVVMVCLGNICRSPMAEQVLRSKANQAQIPITVASAGTGGWHVGDSADHRTEKILEQNGYESNHRAQKFTVEFFDQFDLVLVMDNSNLQNVSSLARNSTDKAKIKLLRDFDPKATNDSEVPDPYYGNLDDFAVTLELVEAAVDGFLHSEFGV